MISKNQEQHKSHEAFKNFIQLKEFQDLLTFFKDSNEQKTFQEGFQEEFQGGVLGLVTLGSVLNGIGNVMIDAAATTNAINLSFQPAVQPAIAVPTIQTPLIQLQQIQESNLVDSPKAELINSKYSGAFSFYNQNPAPIAPPALPNMDTKESSPEKMLSLSPPVFPPPPSVVISDNSLFGYDIIVREKFRNFVNVPNAYLSQEEINNFLVSPSSIVNQIFNERNGFSYSSNIVFAALKLIKIHNNSPKEALEGLKNKEAENFLIGKQYNPFTEEVDEFFLSMEQKKAVEYLLLYMNVENFNWNEFFSVFSFAEDVCAKIYHSNFLNKVYNDKPIGAFMTNTTINKNFQNELCSTIMFDILEKVNDAVANYEFGSWDRFNGEFVPSFFGSPIERHKQYVLNQQKIKWTNTFILELEKFVLDKEWKSLPLPTQVKVTDKFQNYFKKHIPMTKVKGLLDTPFWGKTLGFWAGYETYFSKLIELNPLNEKLKKESTTKMSEWRRIIRNQIRATWDTWCMNHYTECEKFVMSGHDILPEIVYKIFQNQVKIENLQSPLVQSLQYIDAPPQSIGQKMVNIVHNALFKSEEEQRKENEVEFMVFDKLHESCSNEMSVEKCYENMEDIFNTSVKPTIGNKYLAFDPKEANFTPKKEKSFISKFVDFLMFEMKLFQKYVRSVLYLFASLTFLAFLDNFGLLYIIGNSLPGIGSFAGKSIAFLIRAIQPVLVELGVISANASMKGLKGLGNMYSWLSNYLLSSVSYTSETILIVNTEKKYPERVRAKVCYTWNLKTLENRMKSFFTEMENMNKKDKKIIMKKSLHYFVLDKEEIIKVNVNDYETKIKKFLCDFLNMNKSICFLLK
jgi:hypothetical protein